MLPKSQRLRCRRDFRLAYKRGRCYVTPLFALYVVRAPTADCRVGFSVSKKIGGAVDRNRVKRRFRAAVRCYSPKLRSGHAVVIVARSRVKDARFDEIESAVGEMLGRARLLSSTPGPPEMPTCPEIPGCA